MLSKKKRELFVAKLRHLHLSAAELSFVATAMNNRTVFSARMLVSKMIDGEPIGEREMLRELRSDMRLNEAVQELFQEADAKMVTRTRKRGR